MVKAVKDPAPEPVADAGTTTTKRANSLYTRAQTRLREAHKEEFVKILEGVYTEEGLTYKHKRTKEQREADLAQAKRDKATEAIRSMVQEWGPSIVADAAAPVEPDGYGTSI